MNTPLSITALSLALGGLSLTYLIVGWLTRNALRFGLVDRPNERSSHTRVTPRGGGGGIVVVWTIGMVGAMLWTSDFGPALALLSTGLMVAGVSFWDDFRSLGAGCRLLVHIAAAGAFLVFGVHGGSAMQFSSWADALVFVVAVLAIVGFTNIFNFMDGIDGLAGVQAVVAATAWTIAGIWLGQWTYVWSAALLAGGAAGFLAHNWSPARIFMGDVGSAFCGFVFAAMGCWLLGRSREVPDGGSAISVGFSLTVVGPFVADGVFTLMTRAVRGEAIWTPHRSHLYQRLVKAGWSHRWTATYYGLWAVLCAAIALGMLRGLPVVGAIAPALFLSATWLLVQLAEARTRTSG